MSSLTIRRGVATVLFAGIFISILLSLTFFLFTHNEQPVSASGSDAIRGFAWSSNIGWLSMNSLNCDADDNGLADASAPAGCPSSGTSVPGYGVDIDGSGNFSGRAWSSNIGWVDFAPSSGYPSGPNHGVRLSGSDVIGWARADAGGTAGSGGWDGWIKMSGSWSDGVSLNAGAFDGYAWGGDVVGWIDFDGVTYVVPPTLSITANPTSVIDGSTTMLEWTSTNMDSCTATGDWSGGKAVNTTDTEEVTPSGASVYALDCVGSDGSTPSAFVLVGILNPNITLSTNKNIVRKQDTVELSWNTDVAPYQDCTLSGPGTSPITATSGSQTVTVTNLSTFTLTCGTASESVDVRVAAPVEEN